MQHNVNDAKWAMQGDVSVDKRALKNEEAKHAGNLHEICAADAGKLDTMCFKPHCKKLCTE